MWVLTSGGWNFAAFLVEYEWTVKFKVNYFNKEVEDFYDKGSRIFQADIGIDHKYSIF